MQVLSAMIKYLGVLAVSLGLVSVQAAETTAVPMEMTTPQNNAISKILPNYLLHFENNKQLVTLQKNDGSAFVLMQLLKPIPYISTTEEYARFVMDYYHGTNLKAQPQRRGYSFTYNDIAPCSGLVSFFDGSSYLMIGVCGNISQEETTKALNIAKRQLGLDDLIYRTSMPKLYF